MINLDEKVRWTPASAVTHVAVSPIYMYLGQRVYIDQSELVAWSA